MSPTARSLVALLPAICLTSIASAQTRWWKVYGGQNDEIGYSVQQTTDSGYVTAGYTWSYGAGGRDLYLIKSNAQGDTIWTRTYGGALDDYGTAAQQTADGGYVIAGYTWSYGAGGADAYLVKADADGDTLWTRTYGGRDFDGGYAVRQTTDGGFVVAGSTNCVGAGSCDAYLIKTNAQGDTLWTRTYGGPNADKAYAVRQTSDGGYVIAGFAGSFGAGNCDVYLIKSDANGSVGVAEEGREPQAPSRGPAATVVRRLLPGAVAFDVTGRRVLTPRSGILFVRDQSAVTKVLLRR